MKVIKALNIINACSLAIYVPYIALNYNEFFFGKNAGDDLIILSLIMFFATFFCSVIIFLYGNKNDVTVEFDTKDFKQLKKSFVIPLVIIFAIGLTLVLLFNRQEEVLFYIASSTANLVFVLVQRMIIDRCSVSSCFTVSMPWLVYPVPFLFFFGGAIIVSNVINEEKQSSVILAIFTVTAIMMLCLSIVPSFSVDKKQGTIDFSKNNIIITLFGKSIFTAFDQIDYIEKSGLLYLLHTNNGIIKIPIFFSRAKMLVALLVENGVIIQ